MKVAAVSVEILGVLGFGNKGRELFVLFFVWV
jgi:hypothetical protein